MSLQTHEIPVVIRLVEDTAAFRGIATSTVFEFTDAGDEAVFIDLSLYDVDLSTIVDSIIEFVVDNSDDSLDSTDIEIFRKELSTFNKSILVAVVTALRNLKTIDIKDVFYISGYLQSLLSDVDVTFRINIGKIPEEYDTVVETYIWGTTFFNTKADVFCAGGPLITTLNSEVNLGLGRISKIMSDVYATNSTVSWIDTVIHNSALTFKNLSVELNNRPGSLQVNEVDVYASNLSVVGGFPVDFKTRSLFTGDFFLEIDRFTTASAVAWVDVVDYLYPISEVNTYLSVNDTVVSGIWFEDIPNGKRLYYDPLDDFYSDGVLVYKLHAESSIGEVEEKSFYLLYGYNVEPAEVLDWGPNSRVVVRLEAQNLVFCPNKTGEAFDFTTVDLKSFNLNCTIAPVGYVDLSVGISPQSTTFYYGKTYTVRLKNIKDHAGNFMPDFEYTFTIESP